MMKMEIKSECDDSRDSNDSYYTEYKYENGNLIKETEYSTNGDVKHSASYMYDKQNRLSQEKFDNIEYGNNYTTNYFYDDNNRIVYTKRNNERYEDYTYDADGNLISKMRSDGTGTEWKYENNVKTEETYYYSGDIMYTSKFFRLESMMV